VKAPALVAVDDEPAAFASLFEAARAAGVRIGWLDLREGAGAPAPGAPAVESGAAKSVTVGAGRVVSVKRVAGPSVLRDLLREHFLGCGIVLVRGAAAEPRLARDGDGFRLAAAGSERRLDAARLVAELSRPRHRAR
jgi:hypothetical protein